MASNTTALMLAGIWGAEFHVKLNEDVALVTAVSGGSSVRGLELHAAKDVPVYRRKVRPNVAPSH